VANAEKEVQKVLTDLPVQAANSIDRPLPRTARYAILKVQGLLGSGAQGQQIVQRDQASSEHRNRGMFDEGRREAVKTSVTAVCVVKTLPARVAVSATSKGSPSPP